MKNIGPFALDTNILIYAHFQQYEQHLKARAFIDFHASENTPVYLSWQICYEYIRIVTHPRIFVFPLTVQQAVKDLEPYLNQPFCQILGEQEGHIDTILKISKDAPFAKGNFIHDCHYAAVLKENGIKTIVTADMDFMKFKFLQVINPTI